MSGYLVTAPAEGQRPVPGRVRERRGQDFRLVHPAGRRTTTASGGCCGRPAAASFTMQQLVNGPGTPTRPGVRRDGQHWPATSGGCNARTMQQKVNGRTWTLRSAADAGGHPAGQNNDSQRWLIDVIGEVYTIAQVSSDRFADAYESDANDFGWSPGRAQDNDSQRWVLLPAGGGSYTVRAAGQRPIRRRSRGRHDRISRLVTRPAAEQRQPALDLRLTRPEHRANRERSDTCLTSPCPSPTVPTTPLTRTIRLSGPRTYLSPPNPRT